MDELFWSKLLESLAIEILPVVVVLALGYLVKVISGVWSDFKFNEPDKARALEMAVGLAVKAAEQAGAAEYVESKKQYALDVAQRWLHMRGVKVDLQLIDAAIEAAVYENFNAGQGEAGHLDDEMDSHFGGLKG
jgi:hypothetical protein